MKLRRFIAAALSLAMITGAATSFGTFPASLDTGTVACAVDHGQFTETGFTAPGYGAAVTTTAITTSGVPTTTTAESLKQNITEGLKFGTADTVVKEIDGAMKIVQVIGNYSVTGEKVLDANADKDQLDKIREGVISAVSQAVMMVDFNESNYAAMSYEIRNRANEIYQKYYATKNGYSLHELSIVNMNLKDAAGTTTAASGANGTATTTTTTVPASVRYIYTFKVASEQVFANTSTTVTPEFFGEKKDEEPSVADIRFNVEFDSDDVRVYDKLIEIVEDDATWSDYVLYKPVIYLQVPEAGEYSYKLKIYQITDKDGNDITYRMKVRERSETLRVYAQTTVKAVTTTTTSEPVKAATTTAAKAVTTTTTTAAETTTTTAEATRVISINGVSPHSVTLTVGETQQATLSWDAWGEEKQHSENNGFGHGESVIISDKSVVSIDENGVITALAPGSAEITFTNNTGYEINNTMRVNVKAAETAATTTKSTTTTTTTKSSTTTKATTTATKAATTTTKAATTTTKAATTTTKASTTATKSTTTTVTKATTSTSTATTTTETTTTEATTTTTTGVPENLFQGRWVSYKTESRGSAKNLSENEAEELELSGSYTGRMSLGGMYYDITWRVKNAKRIVVTAGDKEYEIASVGGDLLFYIAEGKAVYYKFGEAKITYGDPNGDGKVDANDASFVLVEYAKLSTGNESTLTNAQKAASDVNCDGKTDSKDASVLLAYYAYLSTGGEQSLAEFFKK